MRPDKGNGIVVLNKVDYVNKVETLLSDDSKFKPINNDKNINKLIYSLENKICRFLRAIKSKGIIDESTYKDIAPIGSKPGFLYGLPKIHKYPKKKNTKKQLKRKNLHYSNLVVSA